MSEISLQKIVGKGYSEFWRTKKRYRIIIGGRGSKKSTTEALWMIINIMKLRDSNALVIRKIYKDHKDSTYAQLRWAINRLGVSDYFYCKLSPLEIIYLPTRQKIMFRGLDDPMSITSITVEKGYLCWLWFEEFYQITSENDFNMIDMSIRGDMPPHLFKQITGTLNPWNEKHWIKKRFFDELSDGEENVFTKKTTYECNEFLDETDARLFENMRIKNPRRYNVEGLGNWGVAEGLIFDNWEERDFDYKHIIRVRRGAVESAFGLDFGYTTDPTGFICALVDMTEKEIFIFDEHYQRGMLNDQIATMIKAKGFSKELIVADSAEPKSIEEIRRHGVGRIKGARKGKDSILNGIQFLKQFHIIVHPKCVNMILELNNYLWKTTNEIQTNTPVDDFNHLIDPLRYSVEKFISSYKLVIGKSEIF